MRFRALIVAFLAICLGTLTLGVVGPTPAANALSYDDIKNSGLANTCPQMDVVDGSISLSGGSYVLTDLCLQPTSYAVKEEPANPRKKTEFVPAKRVSMASTTIDKVSGTLSTKDGGVTFKEEDGLDFMATTVQLPNGERVPFLFTVKKLIATADSKDISTATTFDGTFEVPSYRTSMFLDPKGRGLAAGYDNAIALPAKADTYSEESIKAFKVDKGKISLIVANVDDETGEISGTFESLQSSDTDMGTLEPLEVKIVGKFYGIVEAA